MRVIVILGCHVCARLLPICSSEGHHDMATEPAKPLAPRHSDEQALLLVPITDHLLTD